MIRRARCKDDHQLLSTRLVLRPMVDADLADLLTTIDGEVLRWQGWPESALEEFRRSFRHQRRMRTVRGCPVGLAVADRPSGRLVGHYSLDREVDQPLLQLGWWLGPEARGRGLGRESLTAMLTYVHEHLGVPQVEMGTASSNERAIKQIRACGAQLTSFGEYRRPNGAFMKTVWFSHEVPS